MSGMAQQMLVPLREDVLWAISALGVESAQEMLCTG